MTRPSREARRGEDGGIRVFVTGGTFDKEYDELK
jgi:hypothetical protein